MMKIKIVLFSLVAIMLSCYAQQITVTTNMERYTASDEIIITNTVKNDLDSNQILIVETFVYNDALTFSPIALRGGHNFGAFEERDLVFKLNVLETMPPGKYEVVSKVLKDGVEAAQSKTSFEVYGTLKQMQFEVYSCADRNCKERKGLFLKGETAFLCYSSDVEGIEVNAEIVAPNGETRRIKLPGEIKIESVGAYLIKATAQMPGYKSQIRQIEVGALGQQIKVLEERPARKAGTPASASYFDTGLLIIFLVIVIMAGLLAIGYFSLRRKLRRRKMKR
ncbi:MAG: hypothetical protein QW400_02375 [Candidatus Diapherotrites archaeon]